MKSVFAIALSLLASTDSFAMNSYRSTDYTCAQLQKMVKAEKVLHLHRGISGGRFASHKKYCEPSDTNVSNAYVPARDTHFCNPGIYCRFKTNP